MPSIYTHDYFNKKVYENLSKEAKEIIGDNIKLYEFGAQGPDIFFFNFDTINNSYNPGMYIHKHSFLNFYLPINQILLEKTPASAYLLGSILHFYLDYSTHIAIDNLVEEDYSHLDIETELDRHYILKTNKTIKKAKIHKLIQNPKIAKQISPVYKNYPLVNTKYIEKSIQDFKIIKYIFNPSTNGKNKLLELILKHTNQERFKGIIMNKKPLRKSQYSNEILVKIIDKKIKKAPEFVDKIIQATKNKSKYPLETYYNYSGQKEY